ncbi:hypothetical protein T310_7326 [Rasamsonia emersonii CBS 393.64]|uniref:Uncharacterized protein n=1 Tax=Rasamsonia emersonii (strain ATCC 16479 / CBS 393.64 / IMI 116815) TaxID=1408163 RepID=A0A0F4YKT1_RASE3|nr:hypothetical protein T310_7326 [Rasamsonia emersonii CBS 393.64]KKA18710.1 hypothetical protein T310_7326 [Rasamsonia emersonii CBS 393.64]
MACSGRCLFSPLPFLSDSQSWPEDGCHHHDRWCNHLLRLARPGKLSLSTQMTPSKIASNRHERHVLFTEDGLSATLNLASPSEATQPSAAPAGQWAMPYRPMQEKRPDAQRLGTACTTLASSRLVCYLQTWLSTSERCREEDSISSTIGSVSMTCQS